MAPTKPIPSPRHHDGERKRPHPLLSTKHTLRSTGMTTSHHGIRPTTVHNTAIHSSATYLPTLLLPPAQNFQPSAALQPTVSGPSPTATAVGSDSPLVGDAPVQAQPTVISTAIAAGVAVTGAAAVILVAVLIFFIWRHRRRQRAERMRTWRISPFPAPPSASPRPRPETACEIWDTRPPSRWTVGAARCTTPQAAWTVDQDRCCSPETDYVQSPMETPTSATFLISTAPRRSLSPPRADSVLSDAPESILAAFPSPPPTASVRVQRARVVHILDAAARERLCRACGLHSAAVVLQGQEHVARRTSS